MCAGDGMRRNRENDFLTVCRFAAIQVVFISGNGGF